MDVTSTVGRTKPYGSLPLTLYELVCRRDAAGRVAIETGGGTRREAYAYVRVPCPRNGADLSLLSSIQYGHSTARGIGIGVPSNSAGDD